MNWDVFTQLSPPTIQWHWATATLAFFIGLFIFARPKGTLPHKSLGAFYMALMLTTCVAAFFIRRGDVSGWQYLSLQGMTWIHIFIPVTLYGIIGGLIGIYVRKNPKAHSSPLIGSYLGGMTIAGGLTFLPGRRMHMLFFEDPARVAELIAASPY